MRPRRAPPAPLMLTRRALANSLVAGAAVVGLPVRPVQAVPAIDPALRDAALRGLALAGQGAQSREEASTAPRARLAWFSLGKRAAAAGAIEHTTGKGL